MTRTSHVILAVALALGVGSFALGCSNREQRVVLVLDEFDRLMLVSGPRPDLTPAQAVRRDLAIPKVRASIAALGS